MEPVAIGKPLVVAFGFANTVNVATTGATSLSLDGSVSSNGGSNPPNVPEPASFAVLGTALLGFGAFMRRTRRV